MADKSNHSSTDTTVQQLADLLDRQQKSQGQQTETMSRHLNKLIELQQENNLHTRNLEQSVLQLDKRVEQNNQQWRRRRSKEFFRKMLLEVPPVVLAVLLAFGINSWWQQRRADIAAEKAYRNIVSELQGNLGTCKYIVQLEEESLQKLDSGIQKVEQGEIDLDENYGGGFMAIPLRSAAWQTASISNALSSFEDSLIIDLASAYEFVEAQENWLQLTTTLDLSQRFKEEELLSFLKTNQALLQGHITNTKVTIEEIEEFLEKYGELDAEE